MIHTKERILDTAEKLFSEQGYDATSLRHITAEAEVNLAAIHYHFGSKEELLDEVIRRKVAAVNERRMAMLTRFEEDAAPEPAPVNKVLEAFVKPALEMADRSPAFARLMGRIMGEDRSERIVEKHFRVTATRFLEALRRALKGLPEDEVMWRTHFMIGAMAHTLCRPPWSPTGSPIPYMSPADRSRRLVTFVSAGFQAPAGDADEMRSHR